MPTYRFTVDGERSPLEEKTATLPDDNSAWDYGESLIREMLNRELDPDEPRRMVIAVGDRIVGTIAFNLDALQVRRTLQ
jgi:hypothetical protein